MIILNPPPCHPDLPYHPDLPPYHPDLPKYPINDDPVVV